MWLWILSALEGSDRQTALISIKRFPGHSATIRSRKSPTRRSPDDDGDDGTGVRLQSNPPCRYPFPRTLTLNKICCLGAAVLAAAVLLLVYKFLWLGETLEASDGRSAIVLSTAERNLVLSEMRAFLQAVQQIVAAAQDGDNAAVALAARRVGAAAQQSVPAGLVGKLPGEFKLLGFDTHRKFDALALDAEQLGDPSHSLAQLA